MIPAQPITFDSLLAKYGGRIYRANELEIKAARNSVPRGVSWVSVLHRAICMYNADRIADAAIKRKRPPCINRTGICEEDKCNCW